MRFGRFASAATATAVVGLFAQTANAAPRADQRCVPAQPRSGYYGTTLSQSFQPASPGTTGVDILLGATSRRTVTVRLRLVGRHALPNGLGLQLTVLAEQQVKVSLPAFRPTWAKMRLTAPIHWATPGPAADEYAVEAALPAGDNTLFWLSCDGYQHGHAAADEDPGSVEQTDTGTAVTATEPGGLAFILYGTTR
jgi:hypothetical protein